VGRVAWSFRASGARPQWARQVVVQHEVPALPVACVVVLGTLGYSGGKEMSQPKLSQRGGGVCVEFWHECMEDTKALLSKPAWW